MQCSAAGGLRLAGSRSAAVVAAPAAAVQQQAMCCSTGHRSWRRASTSGTPPSSSSSSSSSSLHRHRLAARQPRLGALRPCAATGAAATGDSGQQQPPQQQQPLPPQQPRRPPREMSMIQRWRALKFAAKEAAQRMSEVPAIAAVLAALAALNAQLQPLRDAWARVKRWEEAVQEDYNAFIAEETRRQWAWSKRYSKELAWWGKVPAFMGFFATTLLYQAFMPVSLAVTVLLPLYYSWVLWDAWWASPIFLATLITAPMKWVPWADKCLLWPGLI